MSKPVVTAHCGTTISAASKLLYSNTFSALPVVDDNDQLVGIVSEADLMARRFPRDPRYRSTPDDGVVLTRPGRTVADVMTTHVIAVPGGTDVADLADTMLSLHLRSVPIVDDSRVIGIVTRRDLIRTLVRDESTVARDVRHRLEIYGGPNRWTVSVSDGVATIGDTHDDETDRHVAKVIAESVPGITRAEIIPRVSG